MYEIVRSYVTEPVWWLWFNDGLFSLNETCAQRYLSLFLWSPYTFSRTGWFLHSVIDLKNNIKVKIYFYHIYHIFFHSLKKICISRPVLSLYRRYSCYTQLTCRSKLQINVKAENISTGNALENVERMNAGDKFYGFIYPRYQN